MVERRLTEAKRRRAIDALVALLECDDFLDKGKSSRELADAIDFIRELPVSR